MHKYVFVQDKSPRKLNFSIYEWFVVFFFRRSLARLSAPEGRLFEVSRVCALLLFLMD
jgi:hypothetical protein